MVDSPSKPVDARSESLAYLNWGRWVADCPVPDCTDAREIYPLDPPNGDRRAPLKLWTRTTVPQTDQVCANGHRFRIVMPADEHQIDAVMAGRDEEGDRYWYPRGHPQAIEHGLLAGLSLDELAEQGREHNARRAAGRGSS